MIVWPAKDPAEVLDFTWDPPLDAGDTIASYTATRTDGTVSKDSDSKSATQVTLWLSGGADGETDTFALTATTDGGRTFREIAVLPVFDRASALLALFRVRYGAFSEVADGTVGYWLAAATGQVGDEWAEADRDPAKLALAAHMMTLAGVLTGGASMEGIQRFRSGSFEAYFSDTAAGRTGYNATTFGREFLLLRRRNFIGLTTAWAAPAICGPGCIPGDV